MVAAGPEPVLYVVVVLRGPRAKPTRCEIAVSECLDGIPMGADSDLLQSSTPLDARLFQVVCGHPAFLEAPVLKTAFRKPLGHFPPLDLGAVAVVEGCWGLAWAIDEIAEVEAEPSLKPDPVPLPTLLLGPPAELPPQPGI